MLFSNAKFTFVTEKEKKRVTKNKKKLVKKNDS